MELTNNSPNAMNVALFNYADFDISDTAGSDSATLISPTELEIREGSNFVRFAGVGADNWQVTSFSTLRGSLLDGGVTTLTDTGAPFGPGDFTGAFQWNLAIDPGETVRVRENLYVNQIVPEPASLCLLALGGLAMLRRRA